MTRIRTNRSRFCYTCLAVLGLLTASGCGDDRPMVAGATSSAAYRPPAAPTQAAVTQIGDVSASPTADPDPLATPDPLAGTVEDKAADMGGAVSDSVPDPLAGEDLGSPTGPKMPTQHSHWLSVSQFGARVTVRLNGVWYGEFYGPTLGDITMRLRPGPNTLTVTYAPQSDAAWLAVHVTEGEHDPPMPDLVVYRVAPLRETAGGSTAGPPAPTTRTFQFMAQ